MSARLSLSDFAALIRREGGLAPLFLDVGVDPAWAPLELADAITAINTLARDLETEFDRISEACGYDPDEEN